MPPLDTPLLAYERSAALIAERLRFVRGTPSDVTYLNAELMALQVRKIVEGVAFAALSALEHSSSRQSHLHTKDADRLLGWLEAKGLLHLPQAKDVARPDGPSDYAAVISGAPARNLTAVDLKAAFSSASQIVHERHPEKLTDDAIAKMCSDIRSWTAKLDAWLWTHTTFLTASDGRQMLFLVQRGMLGTTGFFCEAGRPPGWKPE